MIRLLTFIALLTSTVASADWYTSDFRVKGTYLDLVAMTKAIAFDVHGKAVVDGYLSAGHLVVNEKVFQCRSVGRGALTSAGVEQTICNVAPNVFLELLSESLVHDPAFNNGLGVLKSYFSTYTGAEYTTIPVAFTSAPAGLQTSDYTLQYTEPHKKLQEVDFEYQASTATKF